MFDADRFYMTPPIGIIGIKMFGRKLWHKLMELAMKAPVVIYGMHPHFLKILCSDNACDCSQFFFFLIKFTKQPFRVHSCTNNDDDMTTALHIDQT